MKCVKEKMETYIILMSFLVFFILPFVFLWTSRSRYQDTIHVFGQRQLINKG